MGWAKHAKSWHWWVLTLAIAAVAISAIVLTSMHHKQKSKGSHSSIAPDVNAYPEGYDSVTRYAEPLKLALRFFSIQKSGKLPADNPISWRGDSALTDGNDVKLDLTGGLYDAGDTVKFGFPMAFTATVLAWSILEYQSQYEKAGLLDEARGTVRWITDYFIKAHPSKNELYFQVGNPAFDHVCWERPEDMDMKRPSYKVDPDHPGSDVAGETAAAMAAASLVFRDSDSSYSDVLVSHAKDLFSFADTYKASYSASFPSDQGFYNSTGYYDDLLWGSTWLYYATQDTQYLQYVTGKIAETYAGWGSVAWFSWDNKLPGVQVLLSRSHMFKHQLSSTAVAAKIVEYKTTADSLMCAFLPDSPSATVNRTKAGMLWVSQWDSVQHAVNSALLALIYSDYMTTTGSQGFTCSGRRYKPAHLRVFARNQADYFLGKNPAGMSYLVGYGHNYPKRVHHRGASIPVSSAKEGCKAGFRWLHTDTPNPNLAIGALVGGPFQNDSFSDYRDNSMQNEPTTYNNAGMTALLAGLSYNPNSQLAAVPTSF